jgi:hypothetical protein
VICKIKPGKDPALPSSCRPISLLDAVGNYLKKSYWLGSYMK